MNEIICDCNVADFDGCHTSACFLGIQECEENELVNLSYKWAAQAMRGIMAKIDVSDVQTLVDRISEAIL